MSFYGVEWDLTVDVYRFDVGYDRDAPCGLNQRSVYVCERIPIQRVPLESVSGRWLLDAYLGADHDTRQRAYAAAVAQVESESAVALAALAPDTPLLSKETWRHRRRMQRRALEPERSQRLQRLERALAREFGALSYERFDLPRLQAHVTRYNHPRFLRSFYFAEVNARHIRNFALKYANNVAYRAEVDAGATAWARRNALFERNLTTTSLRRLRGAELNLAQADLWRWIKERADVILALPEYMRLHAIDSAFGPARDPSASCEYHPKYDPEMRAAISAWDAVPGVATRFSCQGISGALMYDGRQLLTVSPHEELAYIQFASMSDAAAAAVYHLALEYPLIQVIASGSDVHRLQSVDATKNPAFRVACAQLADEVRLRLGA
jgi:hypothetical protein